MKIYELTTPSFLVDLELLESNIREMAELAKSQGKELWPMIKTHKSLAIAKMQSDAGVGGFLAGTIDEVQRLVEEGYKNIMLAYPVASEENLRRLVPLRKKAKLIISLDGEAAAEITQKVLDAESLDMEYLIIVDSGLHRLGVSPEEVTPLARNLKKYPRLIFKGIATHPGHAYSSTDIDRLEEVAQEEVAALGKAKSALEKEGFAVEIVATGSTPTAAMASKSDVITVLRPGNYVFYDNIQRALGVVSEDRCALTVMATVISQPQKDQFIIDAGSKCLGLDKGAHGNSKIKGYGYVKGHPELIITDLSEEVGKIRVEGVTDIQVGDKIEIIPNHACTSANMTNYLIGYRNAKVERILKVDARGGTFLNPLLTKFLD